MLVHSQLITLPCLLTLQPFLLRPLSGTLLLLLAFQRLVRVTPRCRITLRLGDMRLRM